MRNLNKCVTLEKKTINEIPPFIWMRHLCGRTPTGFLKISKTAKRLTSFIISINMNASR